jgi:hypothetical protein
MIKIKDSVPSIYYNSSRDFQLIGHLFDLVLNAVKTDVDTLFNLPISTNSDEQLLDLMTFTLGLRLNKAKYTSKQLRAICSVAPKMMRTKGSDTSIELLCTALMRADSAKGHFKLEVSPDRSSVTVYITSYATCRDALQEILPYIVPAGMVFHIKETSVRPIQAMTTLSTHDTVRWAKAEPIQAEVFTDTEASGTSCSSFKINNSEVTVCPGDFTVSMVYTSTVENDEGTDPELTSEDIDDITTLLR